MLPEHLQTVMLSRLSTPVWIYDTLNYKLAWANEAGLELWDSPNLEELCSRDFRKEMSNAVYVTLCQYLDDFRQGKRLTKWWTLTPNQKSKRVLCLFSGVIMPDGHMAMLCEAPYQHGEVEEIQRVSHGSNSTMVSLYGPGLHLISANPIFHQTFQYHVTRLEDLVGSREETERMLSLLQGQSSFECERLLETPFGERWHKLELRYLDAHQTQLLVQAEDINNERTQYEITRHNTVSKSSLQNLIEIPQTQLKTPHLAMVWHCQQWNEWQRHLGFLGCLRLLDQLEIIWQEALPESARFGRFGETFLAIWPCQEETLLTLLQQKLNELLDHTNMRLPSWQWHSDLLLPGQSDIENTFEQLLKHPALQQKVN
ncbi:hypothetical protein ACKC9G_06335 [Pokkaliibacter sp. CJK22405]|uniref:hypothetical protein n=1 Tax=Pokkaliibacter sp. CJK22405 TaxID=3384615 RepID=UPI0039855153